MTKHPKFSVNNAPKKLQQNVMNVIGHLFDSVFSTKIANKVLMTKNIIIFFILLLECFLKKESIHGNTTLMKQDRIYVEIGYLVLEFAETPGSGNN